MAAFGAHSHCARCRDKGKGNDFSVMDQDCQHCIILTVNHQTATPSYKLRKEKHDSKSDMHDKKEGNDSHCTAIDPASVSVFGVVNGKKQKSPDKGMEKKTKSKKRSTPAKSFCIDNELTALDQKWSGLFSRLESMLVTRS